MLQSLCTRFAAVLLLLLPAGMVRADLILPGSGPRPAPRPAVEVPFEVVIDGNIKQPRLEIPRRLAASMRVSLDGEDEQDTRRTEARPQLHLIVAGTALT